MSRPDPGPILVPIKTWLRGDTYRVFEREAQRRKTEIGVLLSLLADRAAEPKAQHPKQRGYVRVTPELQSQIAAMHRGGLSPRAIAVEVGCSVASVRNHLPKEAGR